MIQTGTNKRVKEKSKSETIKLLLQKSKNNFLKIKIVPHYKKCKNNFLKSGTMERIQNGPTFQKINKPLFENWDHG
jgi:hypothetical protein